MNTTSGFVELAACDIATAIEALTEEQVMAASRSGRSSSPAEAESHAAHARWVSAWIRRFSHMVPGRVFFADTDMKRLRGLIADFKLRLSRRYRHAVLADDPAYLPMMRRLTQIEGLEARIRDPEPFSGTVIGFDRAFPSERISRFA